MALFSFVAPMEPVLPGAHEAVTVAAQLDGATVSSLQSNTNQPVPVPAPEHHTHLDHCAHTHLLALGFGESVPGPRVPRGGNGFDTSSPTLTSVSVQPHQRPPIA